MNELTKSKVAYVLMIYLLCDADYTLGPSWLD